MHHINTVEHSSKTHRDALIRDFVIELKSLCLKISEKFNSVFAYQRFLLFPITMSLT